MSQTDQDVEMVRNAVAGMPYIPSMASAAFERIVSELKRLTDKERRSWGPEEALDKALETGE